MDEQVRQLRAAEARTANPVVGSRAGGRVRSARPGTRAELGGDVASGRAVGGEPAALDGGGGRARAARSCLGGARARAGDTGRGSTARPREAERGAGAHDDGETGARVGAQGHEGNQSDERICALPSWTGTGEAKVLPVVVRVRREERRPVHCVQRQPAPSMSSGAGVRPGFGRAPEQPRHRLFAQPPTGLRNGARGGGRPALRWQRDVERIGDFADRATAEQRHADHEPDDLLRGKPTAAKRRGSGGSERLFDPGGIDVPPNVIKRLSNGAGADLVEGLFEVQRVAEPDSNLESLKKPV